MKSDRLKLKPSLYKQNSRTSSFQDLIPKKSQKQLSIDLPPINPDLCLSRSSILEQDKQKRLVSLMSKTISNDVSHILDSPFLRFSPKTSTVFIEELYKNNSEIKPLPAGRIDIEHLRDWLDQMKDLYLPNIDQLISKNSVIPTELMTKAEEIYMTALKEIIKQVSVHSKLRGELTEHIMMTLKHFWTSYPEHLKALLAREKEMSSKNKEEAIKKYKEKIVRIKSMKKNLEKTFNKVVEEKEDLLAQLSTQSKALSENENYIKEFLEYKAKKLLCQNVYTQTMIDLKSDIERSLTSRMKSSRESVRFLDIPTAFEPIHLRLGNTSPRSDSECKTPYEIRKENFVSEVQKLTQDLDFLDELDMENLQDTVNNQIENISDWLEGFKLGMTLLRKYQIKEEEEKTVTYTTQATLPSPCLNPNDNLQVPKPLTPRRSQPRLSCVDQEESSAAQLIKNLLSRSSSRLQKYSKISKKKVLKNINQVLMIAIGKKFSKEFTFADFVLQHLCGKYNIRSIAERKFKELVVGSIFNSNESKRVKLFLCVINAGSYWNFPAISIEGSEVYIKLYEFMMTSKVGVMIDSAYPLEIVYYPLSRAVEGVKQLLGTLLQHDKIIGILSALRKLGEIDQNHVNKEGMIKIDTFVEMTLMVFEDYLQQINEGVQIATESITEYNYLNKREVLILFKHIEPKKTSLVRLVVLDENDLITTEDFRSFCVVHKVFSADTVKAFFKNYEKDAKLIVAEISKYAEELEENFERITEETLTLNEWLWKFQDLTLTLKSRSSIKHFQMWHVLKSELLQIKHLVNFSC